MDSKLWETCIVGAGIIGSATAYNLVAHGNGDVLLIEQFPLPHTRGSSHGQSRVIRHSYGQQCYARMMPECFKEWRKLEEKTGNKLLYQCGLLSIDALPLDNAKQVQRNLASIGLTSSLLQGNEFKNKYPMLTYPDGTGAVLENEAGVLMANRCVQSYQDLFVSTGGSLLDNEKVHEIIPGDIIQIKTTKRVIKAKNLIITAGPWTSELVKPTGLALPLQPYLISVCYWKTNDVRYRADQCFPAFADFGTGTAKKCQIYGLPCIEYPNMLKICLHHGMTVSPDSRDRVTSQDKNVLEIAKYIQEHFANVEDRPCIIEPCMYTSTPDDDFIIDRHPRHPNIVVGAGFSGHGFKLAPVIGKLLAEISKKKEPSYDISTFKIDRFHNIKHRL
ncbi:peroxisomal sarcosine oxidase-like [Rhopilema esculentum]|uniref:peroxisomal sarcosine oxidase-like n=1 Tax=Rhopilema esculentum TaxID=499914 RepID=UPI0031DC750E